VQAERRRQTCLHYAEPTLRSECRNQVYLGYAEPRGVEAHEVWLTAADFASLRSNGEHKCKVSAEGKLVCIMLNRRCGANAETKFT